MQESNLNELPFLAGVDENDQPVFESIPVQQVDEDHARLLQSPLFVRNLASGDKIAIKDRATADYELVQRSGNLAIRIFAREGIGEIVDSLQGDIEKLGGSLDLQSDRAAVFSVHYSVGFKQLETLLDDALADHLEAIWYYGNVYDPDDGKTPLDWWTTMDEDAVS